MLSLERPWWAPMGDVSYARAAHTGSGLPGHYGAHGRMILCTHQSPKHMRQWVGEAHLPAGYARRVHPRTLGIRMVIARLARGHSVPPGSMNGRSDSAWKAPPPARPAREGIHPEWMSSFS